MTGCNDLCERDVLSVRVAEGDALCRYRVASLPEGGYVAIFAPASTKRRSPVLVLPDPGRFWLPSHKPIRFFGIASNHRISRARSQPSRVPQLAGSERRTPDQSAAEEIGGDSAPRETKVFCEREGWLTYASQPARWSVFQRLRRRGKMLTMGQTGGALADSGRLISPPLKRTKQARISERAYFCYIYPVFPPQSRSG